MKLKQKLIVGFIAISLLVGIVGFLGLYANNQIVNSFKSGKEHFGPIIEASSEVSSYAKRAEGHTMLFLTLHNETDRQKFFMRIASLRDQNAIMDKNVMNPEARKILGEIKSKTDELQSIGESLFKAHDYEMNATGTFKLENHEELIRRLDDVSAGIRSDGLELAKIELDMQARQEQAAEKNAAYLYNIILTIGLFAVFSALFLGFVIAKNIADPVMKLKERAINIGKGGLGTRIEVKSKDEIGELANAFNKMAEDLQKSTNEIISAKEYKDNVVRSMTDTLIVVLPHGIIQTVNPAVCTLLGYEEKELIGQPVSRVLPDNGLQFNENNYSIEKELILNLEKKYISKDLREIPVILSASIMHDNNGQTQGIIYIAQDITERKRSEEELRQSEEKYRTLIENIQDGIFVIQDAKIQFANEKSAMIVGYMVEEITGKDFKELVAPEDLKMVADNYHRRQAGEDIPKEYEFRALHRDGKTRIFLHMNIGLITYMGRIASLGTVKDITKSKMAQEKIYEQAALLDKARDAILVRNLEDRIIYCNKSAMLLYGLSEGDIIGKNIDELLYKEVPPQLIEAKKSVIEKGEWNGELRQVTNDGRVIIVESRWTLMQDSTGKPQSVLFINTDITEKKKLEEQFLRAQRLESIGTLASGVAHDINNVLLPIMLSLELLKEKFPNDEGQKLVNILERSAKRGASLIKQVQSFTRGIEGERVSLQVAHLISEISQIAKETFPRSIEIKTDIPRNLWTVSGDATQLHQVLMNLCVNARDAMPDGGILHICAENLFIDENFARTNIEARVGPYIVITVSDTGTGIPAKIMDRMFEPFFTTKEHGKGTGLGLSTALGIVKSHGGFITIYSEVEKGTTFKVYLPAITSTGIQKAADRQTELLAGCGESILVVDDEAQVRDVTRAILKTHGYNVLTADDGKEAIILYSNHREEIKVVLMDMMMPVMDGQTSIRELLKINPDIKIIAVSGLTDKDKIMKVADTYVNGFLPKPYTAEKLLKTIHEVLGAK